MKITFAGLTASDLYISIHFECEVDTWRRYGVCKVPIAALLHTEVTDAMDRAVRRHLNEVWSAGREDEGLF